MLSVSVCVPSMVSVVLAVVAVGKFTVGGTARGLHVGGADRPVLPQTLETTEAVADVLLGLRNDLETPAIALTPEPVLAAIVIHAVSHSLNPRVFRPYFVWRRDRLLAIASIAAVLALGVLDGLLVAIAISLMMLLRRMSDGLQRPITARP